MTLACKIKKYLAPIFHYLVFVIFLYSALSKLINFDLFVNNLDKSPFFTNIDSSLIAGLIIGIEFVIPGLLFFDQTAKLGYLLSFSLFFLFTGYIILMMKISPYLPCSCGGFLESLSWTQHIYFNIFFMMASLLLFYFFEKNRQYDK